MNAVDEDLLTPLHNAVIGNHLEILNYLLSKGAGKFLINEYPYL